VCDESWRGKETVEEVPPLGVDDNGRDVCEPGLVVHEAHKLGIKVWDKVEAPKDYRRIIRVAAVVWIVVTIVVIGMGLFLPWG
jgi:hypothetical protein